MMAPDRGDGAWWHRALQELAITVPLMFGGYYIIKYVLAQMNLDPEAEQKEQNRLQSAAILRRLDDPKSKQPSTSSDPRRPRKEDLRLTQYEEIILQELVFPEDIPVSFEDIGGLSDIIEDLRESVIYPLTLPELYANSSSLLAAPSGVLLYGPPGCGKTMLAKALAHESGACFINLHISTVTNKWFGDSNKLVNAVFSLARKLEPVIVFIDEIDAVLGTRHSGEHEASGMVKAEFMTHWDGLASASTSGRPQRILILGATNRINDIDDAILRRMPKKFPISLPNASQRLKILKIILRDTKLDKDGLDLEYLSRVMAGMSGSDIKEACREAAMTPVREMIQRQRQSGQRMEDMRAGEVRGLRTADFFLRARSPTAAVGEKGGKDEKEWSTESSSPIAEDLQEAVEEIERPD
ncbi:Protein MSP1 [Cladophialophora carrionii]|uniref:Protein MSP1 n=1 Tax=Cladophialophora carrionii TaxID=86049 RepID=A0A1C1CRI3_9EURO|nr:Protein MSP1 [Cladophialophora carrionii]